MNASGPHAPPGGGTPADRDALVHRVGRLVVGDAKVAALDWESYALVARFEDEALHLAGFAYLPGGDHAAATPADPALPEALRALRQATRQAGSAPWDVGIVRIVRATRKISLAFEYGDPARWTVTPATLPEIARRVKPDPAA